MNDQTAIKILITRYGTVAKAAAALGIIETRMANWRRRGISNEGRPLVLKALRRLKVEIPAEWAFAREHDYSNLGATNGRTGNGRKASPNERQGKRPPAKGKNGHKRHRERRDVSAMDEKNRGRPGRRGESGQTA